MKQFLVQWPIIWSFWSMQGRFLHISVNVWYLWVRGWNIQIQIYFMFLSDTFHYAGILTFPFLLFTFLSSYLPTMGHLCSILHSKIGSVGWRYGSSGHHQPIQNFIRFDVRSVAERIGTWEISGFTFPLQIELLWLALPVGSNKGFSPRELQYAFLINAEFSGTCSARN